MAAGSSSLQSFTCCTLCSASTNPRRAIDGISASLLSMEQGEALRMLRGVLLFFHWEEARGVVPPSLPPLLSPPLSCLTPSGEGKSFGASARSDRGGCQAGRRVEREFDWFLLCCCRRCSGLPKGPTATFFFITFIILV